MILCPCSVLFIYIFKFKEGPFLLKFTSSLLKYKTRIPYCLTDIKIEVSFLLKIITTCSRKMVPFRTKFHFYHCKQKAPFWCGGCVCFQLCGYCWCWNWHISRSWMGSLSCQPGWWIRAVFFFPGLLKYIVANILCTLSWWHWGWLCYGCCFFTPTQQNHSVLEQSLASGCVSWMTPPCCPRWGRETHKGPSSEIFS